MSRPSTIATGLASHALDVLLFGGVVAACGDDATQPANRGGQRAASPRRSST